MNDYEHLFAIKCSKYKPEQLTERLLSILADETARECGIAAYTLQDAVDKLKLRGKVIAIANHYGAKSQTMQATQELAELICELTKREDQRGDDHKKRVTDEIADVEIMLEQIKYLYAISDNAVEERKEAKLERQLQRMADDKGRYERWISKRFSDLH
jgi:hypothetical protein